MRPKITQVVKPKALANQGGRLFSGSSKSKFSLKAALTGGVWGVFGAPKGGKGSGNRRSPTNVGPRPYGLWLLYRWPSPSKAFKELSIKDERGSSSQLLDLYGL